MDGFIAHVEQQVVVRHNVAIAMLGHRVGVDQEANVFTTHVLFEHWWQVTKVIGGLQTYDGHNTRLHSESLMICSFGWEFGYPSSGYPSCSES
ncbi:hypothetical protein D3C87_1680770 [compost metagenome]